MRKTEFGELEEYMKICMGDSAHDREHVYRVLYAALAIAAQEKEVDDDILTAACLLHDIGRKEQFENPKLCHAQVGAQKAYVYLLKKGWEEERAARVRDCIESHRFRSGHQPESREAKILFDADKLDATGALGVARTLLYQGAMAEPLYLVREDGSVSDGSGDLEETFFREYKEKLEKLYDQFYTAGGKEMAAERRKAAEEFYQSLLREASSVRETGIKLLSNLEAQV